MKVAGEHYHTVWLSDEREGLVHIIDQRKLPHAFVIEDLESVDQVIAAIAGMHVRGAPAIGVTAAYGMYLGVLEAAKKSSFDEHILQVASRLRSARPTAINLSWAVERALEAISKATGLSAKIAAALATAIQIADQDIEHCRQIGVHGVALLEALSREKCGKQINVSTHCNAGWLACVDYGTATASMYEAFKRGIDLHVWVSETRPRNQGSQLTAWELSQHGVAHTVIVDNAIGLLMQQGRVDIVIVGSDRVTINGDVANKIGTYLKALAAHEHGVPFYAALPSSSIDWKMREGLGSVPIEERSADEVRYVEGRGSHGIERVLITPQDSPALNYGFDVTPAKYVTGLITERGICAASEEGLLSLYPERRSRDGAD